MPQLLAAHALSGCDTAEYMYGIGKGTVVKSASKESYIGHCDHEALMDDIIIESTRFAAACYGSKVQGMML